MHPILSMTAQQRAPLSFLKERRAQLLTACRGRHLKGWILLSPEGIQLRVAGEALQIDWLLAELRGWPGLAALAPTFSGSEQPPFRSLSIRTKQRLVLDRRSLPEPAVMTWLQCAKCRTPLDSADREHAHYLAGSSCPYCFTLPEEQMKELLATRHVQVGKLIAPLPGSEPRDHLRPVTITAACDGSSLLAALCSIVPHIASSTWEERCAQGLMLDAAGEPRNADHRVRAGERYLHRFPAMVEPAVNMRVEVLYEDAALVVLNKPAPLPMHAAGRFQRNTLKYLLDALYHPQQLRPAHRLDANTTGVLVAARSSYIAGKIQPQFARGEVTKVYLARIHGSPAQDAFSCAAPISAVAGELGGRTVAATGLAAHTEFRVLRRDADGTSVVEARPLTGRTNQIRVHLWHLGWPVYGDPAYLRDGRMGDTQTLATDAPPLCLHAWRLTFQHPVLRQPVTFTAPAPSWALEDPAAGFAV